MRPVKLFLLSLVIAVSAVAQSQPQFEQVLAPFETMQFGGLLGSQWRAELWIRNDANQTVNLFPETCVWILGPEPCLIRYDVPARSTVRADIVYSSADAPGVFMYVPADRVNDIHFDLRIGEGASTGTTIPVVRVRDMPIRKATLLNVPLQFGRRLNLRLYTMHRGPERGDFVVRMYGDPGDLLLGERTFALSMPTDPVLNVIPQVIDGTSALRGLIADRVRIVIERPYSDTPFWPMLTITDSATQHVTVVTPR